jgi:hypothetical protein
LTTPAVVSVNKIIDADANTKIQAEKNNERTLFVLI